MVKHIWSVLCQKTLTDKDSNNISLIEVFERLTVNLSDEFLKRVHDAKAQQPFSFPHAFEMANLWHFDPSTPERAVDARLELIDPTGKTLNTFDYDVRVAADQTRIRINVKIPAVAVTVSGTYWFKVSARSIGQERYAEVATVPLEVMVNIPKTA